MELPVGLFHFMLVFYKKLPDEATKCKFLRTVCRQYNIPEHVLKCRWELELEWQDFRAKNMARGRGTDRKNLSKLTKDAEDLHLLLSTTGDTNSYYIRFYEDLGCVRITYMESDGLIVCHTYRYVSNNPFLRTDFLSCLANS